jgi:hypothetical protein
VLKLFGGEYQRIISHHRVTELLLIPHRILIFSKPVEIIRSINSETKKEVFRAVNISLSTRKWGHPHNYTCL